MILLVLGMWVRFRTMDIYVKNLRIIIFICDSIFNAVGIIVLFFLIKKGTSTIHDNGINSIVICR